MHRQGRLCRCAPMGAWSGAKEGAGVSGQEAVPTQVLPHVSSMIWAYKVLVTGSGSTGMPTLWPRQPADASRGGGSLPLLMGIIR